MLSSSIFGHPSLGHEVRIDNRVLDPLSLSFLLHHYPEMRRLSSDNFRSQHKARSPPPSPQAEKSRPREPYPIPSNNPASQYTLLEKLGTGSFGTVYKAIHNDTKQIVAVKQIGAVATCLPFSAL